MQQVGIKSLDMQRAAIKRDHETRVLNARIDGFDTSFIAFSTLSRLKSLYRARNQHVQFQARTAIFTNGVWKTVMKMSNCSPEHMNMLSIALRSSNVISFTQTLPILYSCLSRNTMYLLSHSLNKDEDNIKKVSAFFQTLGIDYIKSGIMDSARALEKSTPSLSDIVICKYAITNQLLSPGFFFETQEEQVEKSDIPIEAISRDKYLEQYDSWIEALLAKGYGPCVYLLNFAATAIAHPYRLDRFPIKSLHFEFCTHLENLNFLKKITGLRELHLTNCVKIPTLDPLRSMETLTSLYTCGCINLRHCFRVSFDNDSEIKGLFAKMDFYKMLKKEDLLDYNNYDRRINAAFIEKQTHLCYLDLSNNFAARFDRFPDLSHHVQLEYLSTHECYVLPLKLQKTTTTLADTKALIEEINAYLREESDSTEPMPPKKRPCRK